MDRLVIPVKDKGALITILIVVAALLLVGSRGFVFTGHLVAEYASTDENGSREHVAYLRSDGEDVAHVSLWVNPLPGATNARRLRLSVWHAQGTRVESMTLSFSGVTPAKPFAVYLETPQGGWWRNTSTYSDGGRHVYTFPKLGLYGTGTVNLNLITEEKGVEGASLVVELDLRRNTPISLTRNEARASFTLE